MTSCQIWFLNTLVDIHVSEADGKDGISVLEHRAPFGDSPPLHVHHTEDEIFHIIDGEFRMNIAGEIRRCGPGGILLAPKGIPHTYRVDSSTGGRWITVTAHGDFERFVRAAGRRAERVELPPLMGPPSPEAIRHLAALAAKFQIELIGEPLQ
ncbi:MAG TPA: cupin domain-containing protein [Terriglobia bacterium]|jgi:mannose-6-phosphate isomerase-like protein (cupin superfamily)|nr:cupin domain-containing protein [Terriglobia bacterium]